MFVNIYIYRGLYIHNRILQAVCGYDGTVRSVADSSRRLPDTFFQHNLPRNIRVCSLILTVFVVHIGHHLMKKGRLDKYVLLSYFYNIKEKGKVMPFV